MPLEADQHWQDGDQDADGPYGLDASPGGGRTVLGVAPLGGGVQGAVGGGRGEDPHHGAAARTRFRPTSCCG